MGRHLIRLSMKNVSDKVVEFWEERVYYSVPKQMTYKFDLRWRLDICIGHSNNTKEHDVAL